MIPLKLPSQFNGELWMGAVLWPWSRTTSLGKLAWLGARFDTQSVSGWSTRARLWAESQPTMSSPELNLWREGIIDTAVRIVKPSRSCWRNFDFFSDTIFRCQNTRNLLAMFLKICDNRQRWEVREILWGKVVETDIGESKASRRESVKIHSNYRRIFHFGSAGWCTWMCRMLDWQNTLSVRHEKVDQIGNVRIALSKLWR